jgi:hypothetical protein
MAVPGQPITAVWRNADRLDLFMTGQDGRVVTTFFESNSWQPDWIAIHPEAAEATSGQPITAVWRNADHLDLFMTGKDGRVMSAFFEGNSWQPWFAIPPKAAVTIPGQALLQPYGEMRIISTSF